MANGVRDTRCEVGYRVTRCGLRVPSYELLGSRCGLRDTCCGLYESGYGLWYLDIGGRNDG